jgi:hypothetical protein
MSEDRVKASFLNHVRSLFNIDGGLLPELSSDQQREFVFDPVRYFINTDKQQSDAIWREVLKRQGRHTPALTLKDPQP